MKFGFVIALLTALGWSAPSFAQATNASLIGNYVVTGTEMAATGWKGAPAMAFFKGVGGSFVRGSIAGAIDQAHHFAGVGERDESGTDQLCLDLPPCGNQRPLVVFQYAVVH